MPFLVINYVIVLLTVITIVHLSVHLFQVILTPITLYASFSIFSPSPKIFPNIGNTVYT